MRAGSLCWLLVAGCQSGGQTDLVTRELRAQEDQIYAMEDYLAQYQQLVCQYRSENEELKRQLTESADGDTLPEPAPRQDERRDNRRRRADGPSFRSPPRTPAKPDADRTPPEMEIIEPDVPALEETTSDDLPPAIVVTAHEQSTEAGSAGVDLAAGGCAATELMPSINDLPQFSQDPPRFMEIRGEVVGNETGGGPRLQVDIEPLSVNLAPTQFAGDVSLVVVDAANEDNRDVPLADWNFSSSDAQEAADELPLHSTMRFFLELPSAIPTDRETELWVRLMPEGGDAVIGHARVDLSRPGRFASVEGDAEPSERWEEGEGVGSPVAIADSCEGPVTLAFGLGDDDGWSIARPDRPGPAPANEVRSGSQWRAATRPLPVVYEEQPSPRSLDFSGGVRQAVSLESAPTAKGSPAAPRRAAPRWAPERNGGEHAAAKTPSEGRPAAGAVRPVWSAER